MRLGIVTATTDVRRAADCIESWTARATSEIPVVTVINGISGRPYLGPVRAFRRGVDRLLREHSQVEIVACFHDDLAITEDGWDTKVVQAFERHPEVGLAGFGGAIGLGTDALYQEPYDPMQLARIGFRSNLVDAEQHGARSLTPEPVVCLDGFSQIGRRPFFLGFTHKEWTTKELFRRGIERPWGYLDRLGFRHHFYDGALGCLAARAGWAVRYVPIGCQHFGGRTAVGDPGYQRWANTVIHGGDRGFWEASHQLGYDTFRDVLPLRLR